MHLPFNNWKNLMLVKIYLPKIKIYKDKKKSLYKDSVCFCVSKIFFLKFKFFYFFLYLKLIFFGVFKSF